MSLFHINYDKPGPGIEKDRPPQKAFPRFFSIFTRKFTDLIKLNLLFCIPVVVVAALTFLFSGFLGTSYLSYLPLILLSPFFAGLTIVTRNYAREEHAFIFYDFKNAVKQNWKAFTVNGVVCYALFFILNFSIRYYASKSSQGTIFFIAMAICVALSILVIFSQYYVPVMIVTFNLKLTQIYKNAMIFSILGLWRNLLLTLLLAILLLALYIMQVMMLTLVIEVFLLILLLFSLAMFLINFVTYPLVDKMMIQPYLKKNQEAESQMLDDSEASKYVEDELEDPDDDED